MAPAVGYIGGDMKCFRNSAAYATPTWTEVTICRDVTLDMSKGTADLSRRGSKWRRNRGTLLEGTVTLEFLYSPTDTHYEAFKSAFLAGTIVDVALADGPIAGPGVEYFRS